MSKGDTFENDLLKLIFNGTPITGLADNTATAPLTDLYVALHSADPGEDGVQTTSEMAYTGYTRVAVPRDGSGWIVNGSSVSPAANIDFPVGADATGAGNATHFSIGTDASAGGKILYSGAISPAIACGEGVTPRLSTNSTITED